MKRRWGRCLGKSIYRDKSRALYSARRWFLQNGTRLSVYECPKCLDFHLTSKPNPAMIVYYERWALQAAKEKAKLQEWHEENRKKNELRRQVEAELCEFNKLYRDYCERLGIKVNKKKPPTILKGTLPLALQRQKLAELKQKQETIASAPNLWISIKSRLWRW